MAAPDAKAAPTTKTRDLTILAAAVSDPQSALESEARPNTSVTRETAKVKQECKRKEGRRPRGYPAEEEEGQARRTPRNWGR